MQAHLAGLGGTQAREVAFTSMIVFPTRGGQTRLVQVRALEGGFPFYGEAVTLPAACPKDAHGVVPLTPGRYDLLQTRVAAALRD